MDSGGSKTQKTTQTTQPYKPSQPGLNQSIGDVTKLYNSGGLNVDYPDQTVAALSPETQDYWNMTAQRATNGSPLLDASQGYLTDTLNGKYLGADAPGFSDVLSNTRDMVNANASAGSRYGSGVHQGELANQLGQLEFQNYNAERGRMDNAAGIAPGVAQADYFDLGQLGQVGQQRQQYQQSLVDDRAARQQWEQSQAANRIALYQQLLGGNFGGTTTAYQPGQSTNPWLLGLGALTGLGGSALGNPGLF